MCYLLRKERKKNDNVNQHGNEVTLYMGLILKCNPMSENTKHFKSWTR